MCFVFVAPYSCSDLVLPLCFNVRSRLGPSSVQSMALRKRWSVRRRSDLGLRPWRMPKLPKRRLCRGLGSRSCGVGPNLSRSRLSRNRKKRRLRRQRSSSRHRVRKPVIQSGRIQRLGKFRRLGRGLALQTMRGFSMLRYPTKSICRSIRTSRGSVSAANLYSVRSCTLRIPCMKAVRG